MRSARFRIVAVAFAACVVGCDRTPGEQVAEPASTPGGVKPTEPRVEPEPHTTIDLASLTRLRADAELVGLVAMDGGANLWSTPEQAVDATQDALPAWLEDGFPSTRVVRVLEVRADAVRVELIDRLPCSTIPEPVSGLRGWISRAALLPVLARDHVERHADGSATFVAAGETPLFLDNRMTLEPWLDSVEGLGKNAIVITHEDLAFSFEQSEVAPGQRLAEALGGSWSVVEQGRGNPRCFHLEHGSAEHRACETEHAGDTRFEVVVNGKLLLQYKCEPGDWQYCRADGRGVTPHEDDLRENGGDRLIRSVNRCVAFAASSPPLPGGVQVGGVPVGMDGKRAKKQLGPCSQLRAGTKLSWSDGGDAGTLTRPVRFGRNSNSDENPVCTLKLFRETSQAVCFEVSAIEQVAKCEWPPAG